MTQAEFALSPPPLARDYVSTDAPLELRGLPLVAARCMFGAFAFCCVAALLVFNMESSPPDDAASTAGWPRPELVDQGIERLGLSPRVVDWYGTALTVATASASFALAFYLFLRRSRQVIALLVATFLLSSASAVYPPHLAELGREDPARAFLGTLVTFPFPGGLIALMFLFPDGRFVPRWTALPVLGCILWLAYDFFPYPRDTVVGAKSDLILLPVLVLGALGSQVYRYRTTPSALMRRRLRLFTLGFGLFLVVFASVNVIIAFAELDRPNFPAVAAALLTLGMGSAFSASTVLLMVLLVVSIVRDRLFDIEVVLNRSIVLVVLTALLAGLYALIVAGSAMVFDVNADGLIAVIGAAAVAVVFQPLRIRLQRAANHLLYGQRDEPYAVLSGLSRRLRTNLPPEAVVPEILTTITSTLRLPYAVITGNSGRIVGQSGRPAALTLHIPLMHQGEGVGELAVAAWPGTALQASDKALLEDLATQAGAAMHAALLRDDLQQSRERLVNMREEERRRIRRDLHDGLGPRLAGMMLRVDTIRDHVEHGSQAAVLLDDLAERMSDAVASIRRLVYGLRPPALDELGLTEALRQACGHPAPPIIHFEAPDSLTALPAAVEVAAFQIAQEALTNALRHSDASECTVQLSPQPGALLSVRVADNGKGVPHPVTPGIGLRSMRERAEELGGSFTVESGASGGTVVTALLPFAPLQAQGPGMTT